jgi:membrane peptidoglycan carboxypeptidase
VELISEIGICPVTEMAKKMGVERADGDKMTQSPAISLGSEEMSPLTMANGYATFASRGTHCTPVAIESISRRIGGKTTSLAVPKTTCSRAMSEKTADTINTLLRGVVEDGTGTQAGLGSRPSAGKTGTTDFRFAAWFVGYTPNMAGAVWVGDPAHKRKMINISIGGVWHSKVFGGQVPGPIWRDMMSGALEGKDAPSFHLVDIPDPEKDKKKGDRDRNKNRGRDRGNGGDNGGLIGGLIGGPGGNGGNNGGDPAPNPSFSVPEGFLQGQDGGPRGTGNGGQRG